LATLSERLPFPPPKPAAAKARLSRRRKRNRRAAEPVSWGAEIAHGLRVVARVLFVVLKVGLAVGAVVGVVLAARLGVIRLVGSPRFAVHDITISPTVHAPREMVLAIAGVTPGDPLLTVDLERIERRLLRLPWISSVKVRRALPSTLVIELVERRASATAILGGLYLIDENGHPFKKATSAEAADLVTLTGISRALFVAAAEPAEAALREGLTLLAMYQRPTARGLSRPALSEVRIDPRTGFTLVLLEGGTEVALGRGDWAGRLARFDLMTETLGASALGELRQIHLDGANLSRVPVLPKEPPPDEAQASLPSVVVVGRGAR